MIFYAIIIFYIIQRLFEMRMSRMNIAKIHERINLDIDKFDKTMMLIIHSSWFVAMIAEYRGELNINSLNILIVLVLVICQYIRWRSMRVLKNSWIPFPISYKGQVIIQDDIYKFIRHPNYLVVIVEIFLVPFLGGCLKTAFIFSILNLVFLIKRINIEEDALSMVEGYVNYKLSTKKLIPFIY